MEHQQLPPELQQLQEELLAHPRPDPPANLRQRVMDGVCGELRPNGWRARWAFAASLAAAVLVWVNLSLTATRATDCGLRVGYLPEVVDETTQQIVRLLPQISPEEARREALLLQAGSLLPPYPNLKADAADHWRIPCLLGDKRPTHAPALCPNGLLP
jgi:hypothetical protein